MQNQNKAIIWGVMAIIGISVIAIFKALLLPGPLAWGDAPFFTSPGMKELLAENYIWISRGNILGGLNQFLWLYPLMFIWGLLHSALGISNDLIIRLLFYFPSLLLTLVSSYVIARQLKLSIPASLLASLFYTLNTYYLLLVDGGQVGVALAYGLFPFSFFTLQKLIKTPNRKNFYMALGFNFILGMVDPRILVISTLTVFCWVLINIIFKIEKINWRRSVASFVLLGVCLAGLFSYWIIPMLLSSANKLKIDVSSLQLVSLLNTLLAHQPHWPGNLFGVTNSPPAYFVILPILIFTGVFYKKNKIFLTYAAIFLVSAFAAKGNTPPLGQLYNFALTNIPFGEILRDSTKFYFPLILSGSLLIAYTAEVFSRKWGQKVFILIAILLISMVHPAMTNNMNFVLSARSDRSVISINELISKQEGSFRTAWFPEKHPLSFHTNKNQALDAKSLVELLPLQALNVGDYDRFNYIHKPEFLDWYKLFGIKYLVLSGDPRQVEFSQEEQNNWDDLNQRVATTSGLVKKDWSEKIPVYEIPTSDISLWAAEKAVVVVGGTTNLSPNTPMLLAEDGKFDTNQLSQVASESANLYFDSTEPLDLTMSMLKKHFVSPSKFGSSEWARWDSSQRLKWKYEALIRGVETMSLDYDLGVATSDAAGEQIKLIFPRSEPGEYILAVRAMSKPGSKDLFIQLNQQNWTFSNPTSNFKWFTQEVTLSDQLQELSIKNTNGFWILNTAALIPKKDWQSAKQVSQQYMSKFRVLTQIEFNQLKQRNTWEKVENEAINPVSYNVSIPEGKNWLLMPQGYHPSWKAGQISSSAMYGSLNSFYVKQTPSKVQILFIEQDYARWGLYFWAISILVFAVALIYSTK